MGATDRYDLSYELSGPQPVAIDAIIDGADYTKAAEATGVHRVAVSRWANHHPEFEAELNRRRDLLEQKVDRIRLLDDMALEHLQERIQSVDDGAVGKIETSAIGPTDGYSM